MKRPRLALAAFPVLLTSALATVAAARPAPAPQGSNRAVQDEMAFARELAVRYQYIDLAEEVLGRIPTASLSDKQKESLDLVQCQVYSEGARREGDPEKRLQIFSKAKDSFSDFFKKHPFSELLPEAEASYLSLVNNYGRALELALEDAVGEEAEALRGKIRTVLEDGLERTSSLKEAYDRPNLTPAEKLEKWSLMLDRAQMLTTFGRVSEDPEFLYSQASGELERVATEAGETSGPGLNAFRQLAQLNLLRGRYGDAEAFAQYVIEVAVPPNHDNPDWQELPFEIKAERFKLVELTLPDLLEALNSKGDSAKACEWALYYYNTWRREGFTFTPYGYLAVLACARTLLDAGGWVGGSMTSANLRWFENEEGIRQAGFSARDSRSALELALRTAQDVNDENQGNVLQVRAQKLISDVISRPGVSVPPEVLFQAAQGEYNTQNFHVAIDSLKGVMRALDGRDAAARQEYMPRVLFYLGQSYSRLDRPLEAAMAFRDAATTWSGDPEYQPRVAQGYYREISTVRRDAANDSLINSMYLEAESLFQQSADNSGVVTWRQAERAYNQQDWSGARAKYLEVEGSTDEHEKAIVKAALCLYKENDRDGAAREFEQYLKVFVPDPANAISGARKQAARDEARAQATYYLGKMAYDSQEWDEAIQVLGRYDVEFPEQTDYAPNALYMVTLAQIAKKDLAAAKKTCETLQEKFADKRVTGIAAFNVFQALKSEREAAEAAGDSARAMDLARQMAHYVRVANRLDPTPNFPNLRVESGLWLELRDWKEAEEALRTTLRNFKDDRERAGDLEKFVMPDLGQALLGQKRVPEAFEVLDPLVPKDASDTRKPSSTVVRDWARSVTGWVEGDGDSNVEVPGVGGDFKTATDLLNKLVDMEAATNEAWSCPWYALKFDLIYAYLQWSRQDSAQRETAKRVLDDISSMLGDPTFKDIADKCGDEALRKRFRWLQEQLR